MNIRHDSRKIECRKPFGAVETGTKVSVSLYIGEEQPTAVRLMLWRDDEPDPKFTEMKKAAASIGVRYAAEITVPDDGCLIWYAFEIETEGGDGRETFYYGNRQKGLGGEGQVYHGSRQDVLGCCDQTYHGRLCRYQITVHKPQEVPEWYKNGIVYQIFPDRFARDEAWHDRVEKANSRVNSRRSDIRRSIEENWTRPAYYVRDEERKVVEWPMYGGSLRGIESRLDYLKSLGVSCIYLNPIFEATSNHRYDTGDYMHIEPALGTEEDFKSLAQTAKAKGIRLILDGVFSHTGADSVYFDKFGNYRTGSDESGTEGCKESIGQPDTGRGDGYGGTTAEANDRLCGEAGSEKPDNSRESGPGSDRLPGAWGHPDSPYRSWYKFDDNDPYGYKTWWGTEDLPEVYEEDPSYREFILGDKGVVKHWLDMGASGWRLDVADELPDSFIRGVRSAIKTDNPDGLLIGEVWEDASNKVSYGELRRYLQGEELDSTMNYPLRDILLDYINYTISAGEAADKFMSLAENYPRENLYAALNLIGSHDRERILELMAGKEDPFSAALKVKLLSTLQYCLPGVPCIYYGDEAGLMGGKDPENRSGFPWGHENQNLEFHYRMLGLMYEQHPALKDGDFGFVEGLGDDIFAFTRSGRDAAGTEETLLILANRSYGPAELDFSGVEFNGTGIGGIDFSGNGISSSDISGSGSGGNGISGTGTGGTNSGTGGYGYALELLTSEELPLDETGHLKGMHMDRLSVKVISLRKNAPAKEDMGRSAGVICHISSLPGGKLGSRARDFVDYIASAGFGVWQILPLNPAGLGGSPYSSFSAFAAEPGFIDYGELPPVDGLEDFVEHNSYWLYDYLAYMLLKETYGGRPWYEWPDEHKFANTVSVLREAAAVPGQRAKLGRLAKEQYYFSAQWDALRKYAKSKGVRIMGDLPMYVTDDSADAWAHKEIFLMDKHGRKRAHAGVPPDGFSIDGQDWGNPLYDWDALKKSGYGWWLDRIRQCAERFDILRIDHFRGFSEYYEIPEDRKPKDGLWQHSAGLRFLAAARKMLADEGFNMKMMAEDLGFLDSGVKNLLKLSGLPGIDVWQFTAGEMMEMSQKEPEKARNRVFYTGTHDNNTLIGFIRENRLRDAGASQSGLSSQSEHSSQPGQSGPDSTNEAEPTYWQMIDGLGEKENLERNAEGSIVENHGLAESAEGYAMEAAKLGGPAGTATKTGNEPRSFKAECEAEALDEIRKIYESNACLAMLQLQDVFLLDSSARMNVPGTPDGNWGWKVPGSSIEEAFPGAKACAKWFKSLAERTGRVLS